MISLSIINDPFVNGYKPEALNTIYIYVILCGIVVITMKNPIISLLFLIVLFSGVALYLIILGLEFIGLSYLIIYIGAISILFLFILMLINVKLTEIKNNTSNSIPLIIIFLIFFSSPLILLSPYYTYVSYYNNNIIIELNNFLKKSFYVTSNMWDGNLIGFSYITNIGNVIYSDYNIWLIIVGFILLLAMVGVIVITIKQNN